jgi:hypothetical protein
MSVYLSNPNAPPDAAFEPGELHHVVVGNTGRCLDTRRTPVSVVDIRVDTGQFVVRIDDFEDRGAEWVIPFERVSCYQFAAGGRRALATDVRRFEEAIQRFDRPLQVPRDETARPATDRHLGSWPPRASYQIPRRAPVTSGSRQICVPTWSGTILRTSRRRSPGST